MKTISIKEFVNYYYRVERIKGTFGNVSARWLIEGLHPASNLTGDFVRSSGIVNFKENETSANITVQIRNDSIPELDELFTVVLNKLQGL